MVLRSVLNKMYKQKKHVKNTYEIYIMHWSYSHIVGIVFVMHQRMIPKGTSWAGPRHCMHRV